MLVGPGGLTVRLRNHHIWVGASEHPACIYSASSAPADAEAAEQQQQLDHTGTVLWPCSLITALLLERTTASLAGPALELGADEMALNNMRLIAEANQLNDRLSVAAFDWSDPSSFASLAGNKFNLVVGSEIVYIGQPRESVAQIFDAIHELLRPGGGKFYSLAALLAVAEEKGFEVTKEDITEEWQFCKEFFSPKKIASESQYHVLKLSRKRNQQIAREAESSSASPEQCGGSECAGGCRSRESSIDVWSCDDDDNDDNSENQESGWS